MHAKDEIPRKTHKLSTKVFIHTHEQYYIFSFFFGKTRRGREEKAMLSTDTLNEHVFFYSFRLFLQHFLQPKYKRKKHDMKKCYKNKITASKSTHVHTRIPTCMLI